MNQKLPQPYDLNIGQITKAIDQNVKQLRVRRDIKRDLKKLNNKRSFLSLSKASVLVGLGVVAAFLLQGGGVQLKSRAVQVIRGIAYSNDPRNYSNSSLDHQNLITENLQLRQKIVELETVSSESSETETISNEDDDYF